MDKKAVIKEIIEWTYCILIALILATLIRYFIGTPTEVKQTSMFPTLIEGQKLILNKTPMTFGNGKDLKRGDIITFESPTNSYATSEKAQYNKEFDNIFSKFGYYVLEVGKRSYIKRVIGLPGEHVQIKEGKIYINGEELEESYLQENVQTEMQNPYLVDFTVPEGHIFAVGDNRKDSKDCRAFGCIPIEKVEGVIWIRFWPFDVFGEIDK